MESIFEEECKFEMKWIIPREKIDSLKSGSFCMSDIFQTALPGISFSLHFYPNGMDEISKNHIYTFIEFYALGMLKSVDAIYTIKSIAFSQARACTFSDSSCWGGPAMNRQKLFNPKFFVNQKFVIEIEGTLKSTGLKSIVKPHSPIIQKMFERSDKDITIFIGNRKMKIHYNILTKRSSIFKEMLEKGQNVINLYGYSVNVVEAVIEFCYNKDIKNKIILFNAKEFLRFSDEYQMEDLKNTVETFLIQQLSNENVCLLSNMSIEFNAEKLRECCVCFLLLKKPDEISDIKNWDKLNAQICEEIIFRALTYVSKNATDVL